MENFIFCAMFIENKLDQGQYLEGFLEFVNTDVLKIIPLKLRLI